MTRTVQHVRLVPQKAQRVPVADGQRDKSAAIAPTCRGRRRCVAFERQADSRARDEGHLFVGESESL